MSCFVVCLMIAISDQASRDATCPFPQPGNPIAFGKVSRVKFVYGKRGRYGRPSSLPKKSGIFVYTRLIQFAFNPSPIQPSADGGLISVFGQRIYDFYSQSTLRTLPVYSQAKEYVPFGIRCSSTPPYTDFRIQYFYLRTSRAESMYPPKISRILIMYSASQQGASMGTLSLESSWSSWSVPYGLPEGRGTAGHCNTRSLGQKGSGGFHRFRARACWKAL
jgi:hypothetical protein